MQKKSIESSVIGCDNCIHLGSNIVEDKDIKGRFLCYCKIRFIEVDIDLMRKFCDFHTIDKTKKENVSKPKRLKGI